MIIQEYSEGFYYAGKKGHEEELLLISDDAVGLFRNITHKPEFRANLLEGFLTNPQVIIKPILPGTPSNIFFVFAHSRIL